ncbi:MAG: Glu/Leu/Phe/Val dehydrogenase dimerization domain-containing protein [Planctomycetota bacterium]
MDSAVLAHASFEQLQILRDERAGVTAILAIHDTRLGPAFGGIRRHEYRRLDEAIEDALRLAEAMTHKCAAAEIPAGGGKVVILDAPDLDREAAYRLVGRHVEEMGGRYFTGPDVGTDSQDLALVAEHTQFVARPDRVGNLAEPTAIGVAAGIRALASRLGFSSLAGVRILVQGLGEVGSRLCRLLADADAEVLITDIRKDARDEMGAELDIRSFDPGDIHDIPADIWAPCAMGGLVHDVTLQQLRVRGIAGSANNVLSSAEHGAMLFERDVLYVPDFVINAGALIHGASFHLEGAVPPRERIEAIGERVGEILDIALRDRIPPEQVALLMARGRLDVTPHEPYFPPRRGGNQGAR